MNVDNLKSQLMSLQNQLNKMSARNNSTSMSPPVFSSREQAAKSKPFADDLKNDKLEMSEAALAERVSSIVMQTVEKELSQIFNKL